jgi:hypothetical protein
MGKTEKWFSDKGWRKLSMSYVPLGVSQIALKPLLSKKTSSQQEVMLPAD